MKTYKVILIAAFCALVGCIVAAWGQGYQRELMNPPGWVLKPTPQVDCYFANFAYYNCPLDTTFSLTRASAETVTWNDGHLSYAASGQLAISGLGLQVWESRTNDALYSNDLTQTGSWTATNVTAAKNATGPDNVANSASTITASAAAGTILQSITLASQADTFSVYVKCVTCTGNIQVAEYPSGTPAFTTLTSSNCFNQNNVGTAPNTSTWVRCFVEATVLNPVVGFKIANSSDSVQVFCNQLEPGAFESPCIPTTTVSVTRAADDVSPSGILKSLLLAAPAFSLVKTFGPILNSAAYPMGGSGGSTINQIFRMPTTNEAESYSSGGVGLTATFGSGTTATAFKLGFSQSASGRSIVGNAGTVASDSNTLNEATGYGIGERYGALNLIDGNLTRLTAWPTQLPNAQLQMLTSLN
jgi:hypothetical protein